MSWVPRDLTHTAFYCRAPDRYRNVFPSNASQNVLKVCGWDPKVNQWRHVHTGMEIHDTRVHSGWGNIDLQSIWNMERPNQGCRHNTGAVFVEEIGFRLPQGCRKLQLSYIKTLSDWYLQYGILIIMEIFHLSRKNLLIIWWVNCVSFSSTSTKIKNCPRHSFLAILFNSL